MSFTILPEGSVLPEEDDEDATSAEGCRLGGPTPLAPTGLLMLSLLLVRRTRRRA